MKKNHLYMGLVVLTLVLSGCNQKDKKEEATDSTKGQIEKTTKKKVNKESKKETKETKETREIKAIDETMNNGETMASEAIKNEAVQPATEEKQQAAIEDNLKTPEKATAGNNKAQTQNKTDKQSVQPASINNMSLSVTQGASNNGGFSYQVTAVNQTAGPIEVNGGLFNLNKSSEVASVNEDIPSQNNDVRVLQAGESVTFADILGPVSGDTPGYYYLTASYNSEVFWSQAPSLQEDQSAKEGQSVQPASLSNMSLNVTRGGTNGAGGFSYQVDLTNVSATPIEVNASLFNLNMSSKVAEVNENIPSQNNDVRVINPGESATFTDILGPVSGDAPGYYYLTASYSSEVFWSQTPSMADYK